MGVILGLVLVVFVFGCNIKVSLNEMQVAACNSASQNNNCGKLSDLGLVTSSDCCSALNKCCVSPVTGGVVSNVSSGLSDVQVTACQSAADNNNCDRLSDLGVVTMDECCSGIGLCCSGVPIDEFKSVLLDAIMLYFSNNPTSPPLSANELKDLITAFFSSTGDSVDLSGIGSYSGERLVDIYAKAKGNLVPPDVSCSSVGGSCVSGNCTGYNSCSSSFGTCDTGKQCCVGACTVRAAGIWTSQVNSALQLNTMDTQTGQYLVNNIPMPQGGTIYALIDPKGFGVPFKGCNIVKGVPWCPKVYFQAIDPRQGQGMSVKVMAYRLDAKNNQIGSGYEVAYYGDVGWNEQPMTQEEYVAGVKWLIELKEQGYGSGRYSRIGWLWL